MITSAEKDNFFQLKFPKSSFWHQNCSTNIEKLFEFLWERPPENYGFHGASSSFFYHFFSPFRRAFYTRYRGNTRVEYKNNIIGEREYLYGF